MGTMPPVTVYWSDTGDMYTPAGMTVDEMRRSPAPGRRSKRGRRRRRRSRWSRTRCRRARRGAGADAAVRRAPAVAGAPGGGQQQGSGYNTVFVGSKGYLGTSGRGEGVGLLPGSRWAEYSLPPRMLTRSPGHQRDWIRACKGGEPACSNFGVAGPYTEWMVLGAVAARVEGKLLWDPKKMEFTNNREANKYVKPVYRKGWELKPVT